MKIAVCVKEVPDSAAPRRIDPHDPASRPVRRGDAEPLGPGRRRGGAPPRRGAWRARSSCVSMGPERALGSLRKALAMGADRTVLVTDPSLRPVPTSSRRAASSRRALERESADLVLFGQQGSDSDGAVLWAAVADRLRLPVDLPGGEPRGERRPCQGQAPDRVRVRRHRVADALRRRRLGRDQRAALPVAQGDHGREEEAAGHADGSRSRPRRRRGRRGRLAAPSSSRSRRRRRAESRS